MVDDAYMEMALVELKLLGARVAVATHAGHLHRHALVDSWPAEVCLVTAQRPQEDAPFHFSRL